MRIRPGAFTAVVLAACLCLTLLFGCSKPENITFSGTVEQAGESSILVYTTELPTADRVSVSLKGAVLDFEPVSGQQVVVTVKPDIGESYPAKAQAVKIQQKEEEDELAMESAVQNRKITAEQAYEMMRQSNVTLVDVRREEEYAEGHIPGAVLLPMDVLVNRAEEMLTDKTATILVYCRSGDRSAKAALQLTALGYETVYDFGGILDWPYETTP